MKVHHRIHNSPPSVTILSQIYPSQSPSNTIYCRFILILSSSHLHLRIQSGFFPPTSPSKHHESPFSPYVLHAPPISFLIWSLETEKYINGQNNINDTNSRLQYRWYSHSHNLSPTHSHDTTERNGTRYNEGHKQFNELIISNDTTLIAVINLFLAPSSYLLFSAPDSYFCM